MLVTAWYAGLTLAVLALAWQNKGLSRRQGAAVIGAYAAFTASLIVSGYADRTGDALAIGLGGLSAVALAGAMVHGARRGRRDAHRPLKPALNGQRPAWDAVTRRASLLPGWTVRRLWMVSMIAASAVAAIDAATGPRVVLIGLLIVGPCIALLTGWWLPAAITGVWACGLAVILGVPDGIWATSTHLTFICVTAVVAAAAAAGAVMIDRVGQRHGTGRLH